MKTETKLTQQKEELEFAKTNLEDYDCSLTEEIKDKNYSFCLSHFQTCLRYLVFIERQEKYLVNLVKEGIIGNHFLRNIKLIQSKIEDLKKTASIFKENFRSIQGAKNITMTSSESPGQFIFKFNKNVSNNVVANY